MASKTSPLAAPHRVITYHDPTGEVIAIDDTVPIQTFAHGTQVATLFAQTDNTGNPTKAKEYAFDQVKGFIPEAGEYVFAFDMPPKKVGPVHFTQSLDYMIVVKGEMQIGTTDDRVYDLRQGDITINLGNVHRFINPTDEWSRMLCIVRAADAYKSKDGKTIKELYPDAMAA